MSQALCKGNEDAAISFLLPSNLSFYSYSVVGKPKYFADFNIVTLNYDILVNGNDPMMIFCLFFLYNILCILSISIHTCNSLSLIF